MTPPAGVTALLHVDKPFGLCSGPFVLTSRMYALCFMFLMVTKFILLGWMSRLAWVSPSQMPIRQLWLLITCPPLGLHASGSHTWLHPDYILPPARFIWLFMGRAALLWSHQKVLPLIEKGWAEVFQNLDLTPLTIVFYVKSKEVMTKNIKTWICGANHTELVSGKILSILLASPWSDGM